MREVWRRKLLSEDCNKTKYGMETIERILNIWLSLLPSLDGTLSCWIFHHVTGSMNRCHNLRDQEEKSRM